MFHRTVLAYLYQLIHPKTQRQRPEDMNAENQEFRKKMNSLNRMMQAGSRLLLAGCRLVWMDDGYVMVIELGCIHWDGHGGMI